MSDAVRSVIEEYSTNIVDGMNEQGDFYLVTHKQEYLKEIRGGICAFAAVAKLDVCI